MLETISSFLELPIATLFAVVGLFLLLLALGIQPPERFVSININRTTSGFLGSLLIILSMTAHVIPSLSFKDCELSDGLASEPNKNVKLTLPNSGFERGKLYWNWKINKHSNDYDKGIDSNVFYAGNYSAYIESIVDKPKKFTTILRSHPSIEKLKGHRIKISAYIKTLNVKKEAGIWARVDLRDGSYILDNMMDRAVFGSTEWKRYDIVLDVPHNTKDIVFGAIFNGFGKAWYDNFEFEIVSNNVPTTEVKIGNSTK